MDARRDSRSRRKATHPASRSRQQRTDKQLIKGSPRLVLNSQIVRFDPNAKVEVGLLDFDVERLSQLRQEHRGTHLVERWGGKHIRIVGLVPSAKTIGDNHIQVILREDPRLLCSLIREWLIALFASTGRGRIGGHRPVRLLSSLDGDEFVSSELPSGVACPAGIEQRLQYLMDPQFYRVDDGPPRVVITIDIKTRARIDLTCRELLDHGVDLRGRRVVARHPGSDSRLDEQTQRLGRVSAVSGELLQLSETREGMPETVRADKAFLEASPDNIEASLKGLGCRGTKGIGERLRQASGAVKGGPMRLQRATRMSAFLRDESSKRELVPGIAIELGDLLQSNADPFPAVTTCQAPSLIFDPSIRGQRHVVSYTGLDAYGPFDSTPLPSRPLRVAVIYQSDEERHVKRFARDLFGGMNHAVHKKGWTGRFRQPTPEFEGFEVSGESAAGYAAACHRALEHATRYDFEWDLALVQIREDFAERPEAANPYLTTKAFFLKNRIPAQAFKAQVARKQGRTRAHILNNISLAVFAKLGGTPWTLPADEGPARQFVVGLRTHMKRASRHERATHVMGLTTAFKADGQYLLEGRTVSLPVGEYGQALIDATRRVIDEIRHDQAVGWPAGCPVHLVFHSFKETKKRDAWRVRQLIESLGIENLKFAFLRVIEQHNDVLLDIRQNDIENEAPNYKGALAPRRGVFVQFSELEGLLSVVGPRDVKRASHGLPRPLKLMLDPNSTLRDLPALARQLFAFSCHSWRTFQDRRPITVSYPQRIARLLTQLEGVDGWSAADAIGPVSWQRWFL